MKHNFIAFYYTRKSVKWNNLKGIFPFFYPFIRKRIGDICVRIQPRCMEGP